MTPTKRQLTEALRYYNGQKSVFESEEGFGGTTPLNSRKYNGTVTGLESFLKAVFELTNGRDDAMMVARGDDVGGHPFAGYALMSGEVVGDNFRYVFERTNRPAVVPIGFLTSETVKEVGGPEKIAGMGLEILLDGRPVKIESMSLDQFRLQDEPDVFKILKIELVRTEGRAVAGKLSTNARPDSAAGFVSQVERLKRESGRNIMKEKAACVDEDGGIYSLRPLTAKGGSMELALSTIPEDAPEYIDECWTFGDVCDWMKRQGSLERTLFLRNGKNVFGISDIRYDLGRPPVIEIAPWSDLMESKNMSPQRRQILEWKKYCDDDMLYW